MAEHVCPFWIGYLLASPLRKMFQNPDKLLSPYVQQGMKVLDIGSAMGFFSLPMAEMVKPDGKVYCLDLQPRMLQVLQKKANKRKLNHEIETVVCNPDHLNIESLASQIDFILACAVVHEVPSPQNLFREAYQALKAGGKLLFTEPSGHVTPDDFEKSLNVALRLNFKVIERPSIRRSHSALLQK